jgi:hypothetical protein
MKKKQSGGSYKLYKTYSFKDKDPVIDKLRTAVADSGESYVDIENTSGVSSNTLYNWFKGSTRRPQHATVCAVARAVGYDLAFVVNSKGGKLTKTEINRAIKAVKLHKTKVPRVNLNIVTKKVPKIDPAILKKLA